MGSESSNTPTRRLRFSLGFLFVLVAICSAALSYRMHQVRQEIRAVRQIQQLGGSVIYGTQAHARAWIPSWCEPLSRPAVVSVDLSGRNVRRDDLELLSKLVKLRRLNLSQASFAPGHLEPLRKLTHLEALSLAETGVTDAELACLTDLVHLNRLTLRGTAIGNGGIVHAADLPGLEHLDLLNTRVTHVGLRGLQSLPNLEYLTVNECCISPETAAAFRRSAKLKQLTIQLDSITGQDVYKLLQGVRGAMVQAEIRPGGPIVWRSTQPWHTTTGGVVAHMAAEANLEDDQMLMLRDMLAYQRPDGNWLAASWLSGFGVGSFTISRSDDPILGLRALARRGLSSADRSKLLGWLQTADPRSVDKGYWCYALSLVAQVGLEDEQTVELLRSLLSHDDPWVRLQTIFALVRELHPHEQQRKQWRLSEAETAFSLLQGVDGESNESVHRALASSLARLGALCPEIAPSCQKELDKLLESAVFHTRAAIASSLAELICTQLQAGGKPPLGRFVTQCLELSMDVDPYGRDISASALKKIATAIAHSN